MLAIEVGPVDVARTRYAISPLGEAMQALRVAAGVQASRPAPAVGRAHHAPVPATAPSRYPQSGR
ncbi:hypothetical protein GCM10020000_83890 [Streptomyces olivoverticillatus]